MTILTKTHCFKTTANPPTVTNKKKKPKIEWAKKLQTLLKQLDSEPKKTKKKKRLFRERFTRHRIRIECRISEPESAPDETQRRRRFGFHVPVWLRNWFPNPQTIPGFVHISIICISPEHWESVSNRRDWRFKNLEIQRQARLNRTHRTLIRLLRASGRDQNGRTTRNQNHNHLQFPTSSILLTRDYLLVG